MGWQNRRTTCAGSVFFRGRMPPRAENFEGQLRSAQISARLNEKVDARWGLDLEHSEWGTATVACLGDVPPPPKEMIQFDPYLTEAEKGLALAAGAPVSVMVEGVRGNVLRDRKALLFFLRTLMGDDGLVAMDHTAMRFWSRGALNDELDHDADLDVEALTAIHVVTSDDDQTPLWFHTHGLAEMGFFDFDVLRPHEDLWERSSDMMRAIAFAIVEGKVSPSTARFDIAEPGGRLRFVDVKQFLRRAGEDLKALRVGADEGHNQNRSIICDPAGGLLGRWLDRLRPSRFLSQPHPEEGIIHFSNEASDLSAQRARLSYRQFQRLTEELAEFECMPIAKIGYAVDGGGENEREHLWFTVHALQDGKIEATLESQPFNISRMSPGQRDWHPLEQLSDWMIVTPLGMVNPRNTRPARLILENKEAFREAMARAKAGMSEEEDSAA